MGCANSTAVQPVPDRSYFEPKEAAPNCRRCSREFSVLWTHRHHCRGCGLLFCDECTTDRAYFEPRGLVHERVRLCPSCFSVRHMSPDEVVLTPEGAWVSRRQAADMGAFVDHFVELMSVLLMHQNRTQPGAANGTADAGPIAPDTASIRQRRALEARRDQWNTARPPTPPRPPRYDDDDDTDPFDDEDEGDAPTELEMSGIWRRGPRGEFIPDRPPRDTPDLSVGILRSSDRPMFRPARNRPAAAAATAEAGGGLNAANDRNLAFLALLALLAAGMHDGPDDVVTQAVVEQHSSVGWRDDEDTVAPCSICQVDMEPPGAIAALTPQEGTMEEEAVDPVVRRLRCGHLYHRGCIDRWLTKHQASCPQCRQRVGPDTASS